MNYEGVEEADLEFNDQLRMELGWSDVASGLNQVLVGYGSLVFGTTVGFGLILISMYGLPDETAKKVAAKPSMGHLWALYLGLGILSIIGFVSYVIIIGGQFKCMMGAAERHGA